jgi:uncharacterized protein
MSASAQLRRYGPRAWGAFTFTRASFRVCLVGRNGTPSKSGPVGSDQPGPSALPAPVCGALTYRMNSSPITELELDKCWEHLRANTLGRLAISVGDEIDIFPINYVVDGDTLVFRTAPGTKLLEVTIAQSVALEIDGFTANDAWSIVVKGSAVRLELQSEIDAADLLPLVPWIPTLKYTYVRITPTSISGREFVRGPEPDRSAF